jgi:hypothetical protein
MKHIRTDDALREYCAEEFNVSQLGSAVYFFSVLHAVDGYGFGLVVYSVENSIVPDSQPVSVDAFELLGFVLPGLFGEGFDFIIQDCKVLHSNGAQVFLNGRLGEKNIHQRRLDFFKRDSISP